MRCCMHLRTKLLLLQFEDDIREDVVLSLSKLYGF